MTTHVYDNQRRISSTGVTASGVSVMSLNYSWDNRSNLSGRQRDGQWECFRYDTLNQLDYAYTTNGDCATGSWGSGTDPYSHNYDYSDSGNITSVIGVNVPGGSGARQYGQGSAGVHQLTSSPNREYTYDWRGNQISRTIDGQTTTIDYDYLDRMTAMDAPGTDADTEYSYNADGARVHRQIGDTITYYVPGLFEKTIEPSTGGSGGTTTTTTVPSSSGSLNVNFGYNLSG
ncbi:MAG: hypothetical protein GY925_13740, partial [Actinomycetia bacterium]|nr:hypothetical protein [Actinomycetes bacterium]